jgi:cytochrome c-type biogenesis protein CcmH
MSPLVAASLALSLALGQFAPQQAGSQPLAPPLEARVQKVGKELRCAVCQGLSITDSPSSMARAQLDKVRELVSAGKTDEEIRTYFVERYGEWALLQPTTEGFNLFVWLGPIALLLGGFVFILRFARARPGEAPAVAVVAPAPDGAEDEYLRLVREEMRR